MNSEIKPFSGQMALMDIESANRFLAGDKSAFGEIYTRHWDKLFSVALNYLRNHTEAEDLVQNTFVRAFRCLKTFRFESSIATWLHTIIKNLMHNQYWYNSRRKRHMTVSIDASIDEGSGATFADVIPDCKDGVVDHIEECEIGEQFRKALERINPGHREILILKVQRNCSYEEISETLGIPKGTVKSRIYRARACAKKYMPE